MKKIAIIIAFYYKGCEEIYHMSAIMLDVYRAYRHAKLIGVDEILFICDNTEIQSYNHNILRLIINGEIGDDFLQFDKEITQKYKVIKPKECSDMIDALQNIGREANRIFFYYSGHAISGNAIIPPYNNSPYNACQRIMINRLIIASLKFAKPSVQTAVILDCCNSTGLNLAFNIIYNSKYIISYNYGAEYYKGVILCISSTMNDEYAYMIQDGSKFSMYIFNILPEVNKISLLYKELYKELYQDLEKHISLNITCTHSRYLSDMVPIWAWLRTKTSLSTYYNPITHTINIV